MGNFLKIGTAAAFLVAIPGTAFAQSIAPTSGTPLASQLYGIAGEGTQVFASSPGNTGIPNVTFTGDTSIHVGSGFAQINDSDYDKQDQATHDWYKLIINPDLDFDQFKFAVQLTDDATVSVYYLLAGSALDANSFASYTSLAGTFAGGTGNVNQLLSGADFAGFMIQSATSIEFFEVKQMSYTAVTPAVPEPSTWAMMLLGFGGAGVSLRRRKRAKIAQLA